MNSLKQLASEIQTKKDFSFGLKNFLDDFYANPNRFMLEEEPRSLRETLDDGGLADAYFGAVAEYLSRENRWAPPRWSMSRKRIVKYPYFAATSFNMQRLLLMDSPAAFRWRNIFVSRDALSRA